MTRQLNDYFHKQEEICRANDAIAPRLYDEYGVNKGLRDENGKGVLTGLTNISNIVSSKVIDGKKTPCRRRALVQGIPGGNTYKRSRPGRNGL